MTEVRIIFALYIGVTVWIPERALKKNNIRKKVPDAIVKIEDYTFVIELELNRKNKRYYERYFRDLAIKHEKNEFILYLVKNQAMLEWMIKLKPWERIYFAEIYDLYGDGGGCTPFRNRDDDELVINELLESGRGENN